MGHTGWGSKIRTYECWDQNPVPYRLAIPQRYPISLKKLVSPQGFEPRTHGLEGRCSIQLSYEPTQVEKMERMMRIELTPSAWKAEVLPLNYIRMI